MRTEELRGAAWHAEQVGLVVCGNVEFFSTSCLDVAEITFDSFGTGSKFV